MQQTSRKDMIRRSSFPTHSHDGNIGVVVQIEHPSDTELLILRQPRKGARPVDQHGRELRMVRFIPSDEWRRMRCGDELPFDLAMVEFSDGLEMLDLIINHHFTLIAAQALECEFVGPGLERRSVRLERDRNCVVWPAHLVRASSA